jgi:GNAT superfamily N-acetyltransferase
VVPTDEPASAELDACLAFLRAMHTRSAERVERFRYGAAMLCDSLPRIYSLTFLELDRGIEAGAADLVTESDRLLAGFGHRRVRTDDDAVGTRLEPEFRSLGWKVEPLLVMTHGQREPAIDTTCTREVGFETLVPLWEEGSRDAGFDEDVVRQIVGQRRVDGVAGQARYFGAEVEGEIGSYCELYTDGEVGQIEGVLTLPRFRNRGLASGVVTLALRESRAVGNSVTFLLAEEHDWPKELYRKLGFTAVGRIWDFLLAD